MQYVFWLKITGRKTAAGSDFLFNGRILINDVTGMSII